MSYTFGRELFLIWKEIKRKITRQLLRAKSSPLCDPNVKKNKTTFIGGPACVMPLLSEHNHSALCACVWRRAGISSRVPACVPATLKVSKCLCSCSTAGGLLPPPTPPRPIPIPSREATHPAATQQRRTPETSARRWHNADLADVVRSAVCFFLIWGVGVQPACRSVVGAPFTLKAQRVAFTSDLLERNATVCDWKKKKSVCMFVFFLTQIRSLIITNNRFCVYSPLISICIDTLCKRLSRDWWD